MKWRLDIKRLILIVVIISVVVLIARGCFYASDADSEDGYEPRLILDKGNPASKPRYIKVYKHQSGKVEEMELEEYITGVVAAEMPASFEPEALRAQAVAARTFAARRMSIFDGTPCSSEAEVCTDSNCCQAWTSDENMRANWGNNYSKYFQKITEAVMGCAGEVAIYDGKPIEALYHSTSGGATEDSQNVFSQAKPYLVGVSSPGEDNAYRFAATVEFSNSNFAKKVNSAYPKAGLKAGKLKSQVEVVSRYESGRVESVRLGNVRISGKEMRSIFSLYSANFTFSFTDDNVVIKTKGFGHGVGMSQHGANAMAKNGSDHIEILEHYYTGIDVVKIDSLIK